MDERHLIAAARQVPMNLVRADMARLDQKAACHTLQ